MNWLDIVIILLLVISVVSGFAEGLVRSAFSLAGIIIGILVASRYYVKFGNVLGFIPNKDAANVVAFIIILLAIIIIATIIGVVLKKVIHGLTLGWFDRLGGAVFGFVLGAFFIAALLTITLKYTGSQAIVDSKIAEFLLSKFPIALGLLPNSFNGIKGFFQ